MDGNSTHILFDTDGVLMLIHCTDYITISCLYHAWIAKIFKVCTKMFQLSYSNDDIFCLWSVLCVHIFLQWSSISSHQRQHTSWSRWIRVWEMITFISLDALLTPHYWYWYWYSCTVLPGMKEVDTWTWKPVLVNWWSGHCYCHQWD